MFLIIAIELFLFIIIDIFGHKLLKIKRTKWQKILFVSLSMIFFVTIYKGASIFIQQQNVKNEAMYLTLRYLYDKDTNSALEVAKPIENIDTDEYQLIRSISSCMDGDYIDAYFITEQLLDDKSTNADLSENSKMLKAVLETNLNINSDNIQSVDGNEQIEKTVMRIIDSENEKLAIKDLEKMDELYIFDQKIRSESYGDISTDFVRELADRYKKDEEIIKLAINYFMGTNDYENAYQYAKKLVGVKKSDENYIIYTDVIAEIVVNGYKITPEDDSEVVKIINEVEKLEKKAEKYDGNSERKEKLLLKAELLKDKADFIDIYRAINYLEAKSPLFVDDSGLYDLQKAKLYLVINNTDEAKKYIYEAIDNYDMVSGSATVKDELEQVINAYNQSVADDTNQILASSVNELLNAQSQGVISVDDNTVNGKISNYITSTLQYDKLGIHISKIDITNYPNIKAYVNINGKKDGIFGLANDFTKKDFEVTDTEYEISDFKVETNSESDKADIAIVMDCSGSMSGQPLSDAKVAAKSCVNAMNTINQEISIVQYSSVAEIASNKTNSKAVLLNSIEAIGDGGDTNISAGVLAGISTLTGATGTKAIILMSDGQDGNTQEAMDTVILSAVEQGITIYTVGLGDTNDEYLRNIADKTGGKFIKASNSIDLENIYLTLQRYIINNYCFSYTIMNNEEVDPRNLTISLEDYQASATKKYMISKDAAEEEADADSITLAENALTVGAVTPNALSIADITKGTQVTITGTNFETGMHVSVGNLELKNINVIDSTKCMGVLEGRLDAGTYALNITLKNSKTVSKQKAVYVYNTGTTKSVKIGTVTITADTIGQANDRSLIATGNVLINGFIHSADNIVITAYDLPDNFDINSTSIPYMGDSGAIAGNGKLYISYAQISNNGSVSNTFAKMTIGGKDYVVANGEFTLGISDSETDIDRSLSTKKISIPLLCTIDVPAVKLYSDRVQVEIEELNPLNIINSIKEEIDDSVLSSSEDKEAADKVTKTESRSEAFNFKPLETEASVSMALTVDNIEFGFTVGLDINESIQFGKFGIGKVDLKLNSLDEDHEYWKIGCDIDFSNIVKGFKGSGVTGLKTSISSYYWYFDKMKVNATLKPGIPIYNVLYIDELGLGLEGLRNIYRKTSETEIKASKAKLYGEFSSELNLFKTLDMVVPKKMLDWGVANIDGTLGLDFSNVSFYANADFKLLDQEMGNASIEFGKTGYSMKASSQIEIVIFDMEMEGKMDWGLKSNWSTYTMSMGVGGQIDWGLMNVHYSGDYKVDITAKADGTYFGIELYYNNLKSKYWYDSNGEPIFWERFHGETYVD